MSTRAHPQSRHVVEYKELGDFGNTSEADASRVFDFLFNNGITVISLEDSDGEIAEWEIVPENVDKIVELCARIKARETVEDMAFLSEPGAENFADWWLAAAENARQNTEGTLYVSWF